jgi:hypothetical protein
MYNIYFSDLDNPDRYFFHLKNRINSHAKKDLCCDASLEIHYGPESCQSHSK